ncbi:hypothetical protein [Brunnivagina elsteri]|uniref:Uncharacterized protein n=1 Tax=Brunnivagina elsteri CCALA 953 TaxID=987040 RepID=A0A2A2TE81_9CYAN|nr:hypothetical protein [Calothrix elsteri]PAX51935.1 hypothetical protein CK510_22080 [Calothrix elsteri CCALA 953]
MKLPKYRNAILTIGCLGILGMFAGCYQVSVSFEPEATEVASTSSVPVNQLNQSELHNSEPTGKLLQTGSVNTQTKLLSYHPNSEKKATGIGSLRMSNQTTQPVRLALLARRGEVKGGGTTVADVPAHWDFAPQEGNEKGLLLSLPNGNLKLEKGDVLVAFAQDGSRRYWGPYIVGETPLPAWNGEGKEWQLILSN